MKQILHRYLQFSLLLLVVMISTVYVLRYLSRGAVTVSNASPPPSLISNGGSSQIMTNRSTADFFLFTNTEFTRFDEFIWYFAGDTLIAPSPVIIHSNTDFPVHPGAYFGATVTTSGRFYSTPGATFNGLPTPGYFERVPVYHYPSQATELRSAARTVGTWLSTDNFNYTYGLILNDTTGLVWWWQTGTTPTMGDSNQVLQTIHWSNYYAIFCDGQLWLKGIFRGQIAIGSAGSMRLMDDVRSVDATPANNWIVPSNSPNYLTLISETAEPGNRREDQWTGIIIANTWENGRENGYVAAPADLTRHSIVITAQVIALNSSFNFEQQNDIWDPYIAPSPLSADNRGYIHLRGNLIQQRRGYVHRSNRSGTGYFKDYIYDTRFHSHPAPFSLTFTTP